jgi:putative transposase
MITRTRYPTDMTEAEWRLLEPLVPLPKAGGRPAKHSRREIINAIFYVVRGGQSWRMLPHDFPKWKTVYHYFRQWRDDGTWDRINAALRTKVRAAAGKRSQPSVGIMDSQSVKTTQKGGHMAMMRASTSMVANGTSW